MEIKTILGLVVVLVFGGVLINMALNMDSIFSQAFVLGGIVAIIVAGIGLYKELFA